MASSTRVRGASERRYLRALIPTECWNFPHLAIGPANGVQPWIVFFEYRDG